MREVGYDPRTHTSKERDAFNGTDVDMAVTMGELHRAGRYDQLADGVARVTGGPATGGREFVSLHADAFGGRRS